MRGLPARRIASIALCAALLVGMAGPAAVAAGPARERARTASGAPLPDADTLLTQVKSLGDLGRVLTPVTDLLDSVLEADNGQLSATEANRLGTAVKDAIAKATTTAPALPVGTLPAPTRSGVNTGVAPADVISDALAALQKAIDELIKAVTSGDAAQVPPAVTGSVTSLVNTVAATLLGGKLPRPSLPGPPGLPANGLPS
ncbi:hypothetical protein ACIRP7_01470 [Streptomyces sp. NPDC102270]|uniref:hypothetical protein n=1 Tax=Streptomyces sp. NPDC102270 TaxID=3366150 RepID=UPI003827D64B